MSSNRTQIQQCFSSIILFLKLFKTFQIGEILRICLLLDEDPTLYDDKTLAKLIVQFVSHINEQNKKYQEQEQYFAFLIVQSLIFNLYRHCNKSVMNNSIYGNSFLGSSNSYLDHSLHSNKHQNLEDNNLSNFMDFLKDFIFDEELKKKMKQMIERGGRKVGEGKNQNRRYADIFLQTVGYILNKSGKLNIQEEFQQLKQKIVSKNVAISSHFQKENFKVIIGQVNKIIFSNRLNRIILLLESAEQNVYQSLLRIYYAQSYQDSEKNSKKIKYFSSISHNGDEMLFNLNWVYVQSISNKLQLFQISKNPLYRLLQSQLLCFHLPTFRHFHQIIGKCCKYDFINITQFFSVCESTIKKDLMQFIENLPEGIIDLCNKLYLIIIQIKGSRKQNSNISMQALSGVKKLLVYSLLVKPNLIQSFYGEGYELTKYEQVCNYLINLFFKSSVKKYNQGSSEFEMVFQLTKLISNQIDNKILKNFRDDDNYFDQMDKSLRIKIYVIEEPILNYDYQILWQVIKQIQFTPKDSKQFQMHKQQEIQKKEQFLKDIAFSNENITHQTQIPYLSLDNAKRDWMSPSLKWRNNSQDINESLQIVENMSEQINRVERIDFLTWMAVGGTRNYEMPNYNNRVSSTRRLKQLNKIQTIPKQQMKEFRKISQYYEKLIQ